MAETWQPIQEVMNKKGGFYSAGHKILSCVMVFAGHMVDQSTYYGSIQ